MNTFQQTLVRSYDHGAHAHVATKEEASLAGDTLFYFLFIELSDSEGCEDWSTAMRRLDTALQYIAGVHHAMERLPV